MENDACFFYVTLFIYLVLCLFLIGKCRLERHDQKSVQKGESQTECLEYLCASVKSTTQIALPFVSVPRSSLTSPMGLDHLCFCV